MGFMPHLHIRRVAVKYGASNIHVRVFIGTKGPVSCVAYVKAISHSYFVIPLAHVCIQNLT